MSTAGLLTGLEALELVAGAPEISLKTSSDLRQAADELEQQAERKGRLESLRVNGGNRRQARQRKAAEDAEKLRLQAQLIRVAAEEVDRRKAANVGEAMCNPVVRFFHQMRRAPKRYRSAA